jgi:hypothetical protein
MNLRKEVIENVSKKLQLDQTKLRYKCKSNASRMKDLGRENEVLKREIAKLGELIKSLG